MAASSPSCMCNKLISSSLIQLKVIIYSLYIIQSNLYNHPQALETNNSFHGYAGIASNLFEGLQIMGMAGLYVQLLENIKDDPAIANYSGFGNLDIPGFFSGMLQTLTKDTCEWVSY